MELRNQRRGAAANVWAMEQKKSGARAATARRATYAGAQIPKIHWNWFQKRVRRSWGSRCRTSHSQQTGSCSWGCS